MKSFEKGYWNVLFYVVNIYTLIIKLISVHLHCQVRVQSNCHWQYSMCFKDWGGGRKKEKKNTVTDANQVFACTVDVE